MILISKEADKIIIKGHANYSDSNDIVCASVSSIMYTTVNAILRFNKNAIKFSDTKDKVTITVLSDDEITEVLLINMMSLFMELASDYPKNIKIESEE